MNSARFTFDNYASTVGYSLCEAWDLRTNRPASKFEEIGRCPASSLVVRPREKGDAVMLRCIETGDEFWIHALSDRDMGIAQ